jgi:hypothetical protein
MNIHSRENILVGQGLSKSVEAHWKWVRLHNKPYLGGIASWASGNIEAIWWISQKSLSLQMSLSYSSAKIMHFAILFFFVVLGDFLGLARIAPILNYNAMNSSLLFMAAGLLLWGLAPRQRSGKACLLLGAGLLAGFDFFIKFSSSVAFIGLMSMLVMLLPTEQDVKARLRRLGWVLLGSLLGVGLYFLCFKSLDVWYTGFLNHFAHEAKGTHNPVRILGRQAKDLLRLLNILVVCGLAQFLVLKGLQRIWLRKRPQHAAWSILLLIGANFGLAAIFFRFRGFSFDTLNALLTLETLWIAILVFGGRVTSGRNRNVLLWFLFLLPFVIHFGSNATFSFGLPLFLMPWFALMFLLAHQLPDRRMQSLSVIAIVLATQVLFTVKYLWFPWRNVGSRLEQTEMVTEAETPSLNGILVMPAIHQFIRETVALSHQASPEKHPVMLANNQMPGVVYWLEGIAPGEPWVYRHHLEQAMDCQALRAGQDLGVSRAVLLVQEPIKPRYQRCLRREGLIPEAYRLVGQSYNPYSKQQVQFLTLESRMLGFRR